MPADRWAGGFVACRPRGEACDCSRRSCRASGLTSRPRGAAFCSEISPDPRIRRVVRYGEAFSNCMRRPMAELYPTSTRPFPGRCYGVIKRRSITAGGRRGTAGAADRYGHCCRWCSGDTVVRGVGSGTAGDPGHAADEEAGYRRPAAGLRRRIAGMKKPPYGGFLVAARITCWGSSGRRCLPEPPR